MVGFVACSRPFFFPYMCHTHGLNGKIMPSQQKEIKMIQFIQGRPKEEPKNDFFFFFFKGLHGFGFCPTTFTFLKN